MELLHFEDNQKKFEREDKEKAARLDMIKCALVARGQIREDGQLFAYDPVDMFPDLFPEEFVEGIPEDADLDNLDLSAIEWKGPGDEDFENFKAMMQKSNNVRVPLNFDDMIIPNSTSDQPIVQNLNVPTFQGLAPAPADAEEVDNEQEWL